MTAELDRDFGSLISYIPVPNPHVESLPLDDGGAHLYSKKYIRLTARQWQLWQMIDGHTTVAELSNRLGVAHDSGLGAVGQFIHNLAVLGFIDNYPVPAGVQKSPARKKRTASEWWQLISRVLHPRLSFPLPMRVTRWIYDTVFRHLFHKIVFVPVALIVITAIWHYLSTLSIQDFRFLQIFEGSFAVGNVQIPKLLITYIMIFVIASTHELGHAMAAMRFGRPIQQAGIALVALIFLASYVRMKDTWLLPRRQRIFVLLSGGIASGVFGALLIWTGFLGGDSPLGIYLQDLGMFSILATVINFYPCLFRTDGYFLLEDLLGIPGLKNKAWGALFQLIRKKKAPVLVVGRQRAFLFAFVMAQFLSYVGLFYWLLTRA
jgi:putative peptide zinc metalloprotease protein